VGVILIRARLFLVSQVIEAMPLTTGQLEYEFNHLRQELETRDLAKYPEAHPLFIIIEGDMVIPPINSIGK